MTILAHPARRVMDFLEDENVQHMDWPAMSPDLNPTENLWIEQHGQPPPPTNVAELSQAVVDMWRDIPDQKLQTLVLSMRRRLQAVYNAREGDTNY